jgi:hypothetical protein
MMILRSLCSILTFALVGPLVGADEAIRPEQILFRRQAVTRMVFDSHQNIPLSSLRPAMIHEFDLMHPEKLQDAGVRWELLNGRLTATSQDVAASSSRWVGGFNPFATYEVTIDKVEGSGSVGLAFTHANKQDLLTASLRFVNGSPEKVTWNVQIDGRMVTEDEWSIPSGISNTNFTLRAQMSAVGVNVFLESADRTHLAGYSDFAQYLDLRERVRTQQMDFALRTDLNANARLTLAGVSASFSPGTGQADIRAITDEQGSPLLDDGRLWFTMTLRGRGLPHPLQGVFSLNPSVFDLKFEGIIVFDMSDGLLRNDLASHLFRDSKSGTWRGWTTGFSALDGAGRAEVKTILAISSTRDPRRGFSVMHARPIGIVGAHEDPHGLYDKDAGKWRLLLCEHDKKYRASIWESHEWDRGYTRLAGPVEMDSTGTLIQRFGNKHYVLFGSADRKIYIRNYPDLSPAGELRIDMPPWNDRNGTRIWPNVIPLPDGYPAPYIALMMDRVNFPGMPKPNWTYGALYLYHGHVTQP